jgi:dolichyl-phosphate beta-glucosyltransferase
LLRALEHAEIAIGSRAIRESMIIEKQPVYRMLMGKTFNKIVQLLAVPGFTDTQCGFKCFHGDIARELFACCRINGFSFDVEMLYVARCRGLKVMEIGVLWRNSPESKVDPVWHSLQMLRDLVRIRFYAWRGWYLNPSRPMQALS